MRRLITALALVLALLVGMAAPAGASRATESHPPPFTHPSADICVYAMTAEGLINDWNLWTWTTVHYGTAHSTLCTIYTEACCPHYVYCLQIVWGDPNLYWYAPPKSGYPYCW